MIPLPHGWHRYQRQDAVILVPPSGPADGGIRYVECATPIARISELIERHGSDGGMAVEYVGPLERFSTLEGEHAAVVTLRGTIGGISVQRDLGFVLLDHHYACVVGSALNEPAFDLFSATVRELTRGDVHLAGVRQRRYDYLPPTAWQARARGLHADWFPPHFPSERAVIHVLPAIPSARVAGATGLWTLLANEERALGWRTVEDADPEPMEFSHGLPGFTVVWRSVLPRDVAVSRAFVAFEDDQYVYPARLETTDRTYLRELYDLARSIKPLPKISLPNPSAALAHWSE